MPQWTSRPIELGSSPVRHLTTPPGQSRAPEAMPAPSDVDANKAASGTIACIVTGSKQSLGSACGSARIGSVAMDEDHHHGPLGQ